ncbi:MAG: DUF4469 domain-containing protein [Bacteroidales bacterium]|jgi:hypothetical protein|nr:DUF4469 domain-containing protein [Bacteroidales bacterium]
MADILHRIKAKLYPNELTEDPDDYTARVSAERSIDISGICRSATGRGGASGKPDDMEQHVRAFFKEMAYLACDGFSVNTGYFSLDTQIKGVFNSPAEKFIPGKHSIYFRLHQGDLMRQLIPGIEVEIEGLGDVQPVISQVTDVKSGAVNSTITPGKLLRVKGDKIKVAGDNPAVGIWFTDEATDRRTRVEIDELGTNNPSELLFNAPALAAGTYYLEVATQYSGGAPMLREPRTARFGKPLRVE